MHGDKPGPKPLLSAVEEQEFATFLVEVSHAGYGKTRKEVRAVEYGESGRRQSGEALTSSITWLVSKVYAAPAAVILPEG